MNSRLVNVRLDERRLERARRLRARGITLSELVRDAIDRRYEHLVESAKEHDAIEIMNSIYDECPDPHDLAPREYNVHDRREARAAISRKLRNNRQ